MQDLLLVKEKGDTYSPATLRAVQRTDNLQSVCLLGLTDHDTPLTKADVKKAFRFGQTLLVADTAFSARFSQFGCYVLGSSCCLMKTSISHSIAANHHLH